MKAVIIKGMEMPERCFYCPCLRVSFGDKYCSIIGIYLNITPDTEGRSKLCPLIETEIEDDLQ